MEPVYALKQTLDHPARTQCFSAGKILNAGVVNGVDPGVNDQEIRRSDLLMHTALTKCQLHVARHSQ